MPQLATWGFEAEFQTGAQDVIASLHAKGYAGDDQLHGYHCDCDMCACNNEWPLKGQTDSSCSGEIISDILTHQGMLNPWRQHDATDVLQAVQESAVEVDAEPGMTSGFHIHVGTDAIPGHERRGRAFLAYLKWEMLLAKIATGRWTGMRDGGNTPVRTTSLFDVVRLMRRINGTNPTETTAWRDFFGDVSPYADWCRDHNGFNPNVTDEAAVGYYLLNLHAERDRHSYLNVRTQHNTWEFRLWNSTRSAWRMDMFSRVSVGMMDPAVSTRLLGENYPQRLRRETITRFAGMLGDCEHDSAAEGVIKQGRYLALRAASAPSTLTVAV